MDDDATDAAWDQQEQLEHQEREDIAWRAHQASYAQLRDLHRESAQLNKDFDRIFSRPSVG